MRRDAISIAIGISLSLAGAPTSLVAQQNLFTASSGAEATLATPDGSDELGTRRRRSVSVSFDVLAPGPLSSPGDLITLNLFPDAVFTAVLDSIELTSGGYAWIGHGESPDSSVILAARGNYLAGNISIGGRTFQVRPAADGTHTVSEVDLSRLPPEMEPFPVGFPEAELDLPTGAVADDGSVIDVMVVYTQDARIGMGGTPQILALIDLAVVETNTSYANSGIVQRLQLVHTAEVSYTESGSIFTDLNALTLQTDGQMDSVHPLRDTHLADEVVLLIDNGGPYCGVAWLMTTVSTSFESSAFAVVDTGCATGYYSFGHELGHNMGARHDRYVDNTDGSPYLYNHGYLNTANRWRTVMGYNNACSALGFNCTRLPYWSNPDVTYGGAPMGIPEGSANAADNRKTLNNTAFTVANFRQSVISNPTLDVTLSGSGSGTVTSVPAGINCGVDCSESYSPGTSVTLTATPAAGSFFAGWSAPCSGTGTCVLSMTQAWSVTATFLYSVSPSLSISTPAANESWTVGTTHNVSWTASSLSSGAQIYLYYDDGGWVYITNLPRTATSYDWTLPATPVDPSTLFVGSYYNSNWETYDTTSFRIVPSSSDTTDFYTVNPCRVLDTRQSGSSPALAAGVERKFQLSGNCGVPAGAKAVSVNIAVTEATADGNVRLYPGDAPVPGVSTINYVVGQTRSNNAVIPLNGAGELTALASQASGTVHFILDVNGYFK